MISIDKITDSEKLNYLDSDFCWSNIKYLDTIDYRILHDESVFSEEDIVNLCSTFEDKTQNSEVMFGAIHLLESLSSESAYENTIIGVVNLYTFSPGWAKIIVYRLLNDEFSVQMIKCIYNRIDKDVCAKFKLILETIKREDSEKYGKSIAVILDSNQG
ncbi:Imm30 family immunity protein [Butyrivibrio fibrisolvens]|uniref:Imm30 family immunity protein n=1 Tax=Butyrivibrio fibrisolvens TaxID=831 RepID=UPI0020C0183D|nr:Imm30 family immunity protein [Butyrivibrio fibrisolvens]